MTVGKELMGGEMRLFTILVLGSVVFPSCVHAQEQNAGAWSTEAAITLTPKIGTPLPLPSELDPVDNSGIAASVTFERRGRTGLTDFAIEAGTTYAPQLLDDNDEQSSIYAKATIGDRYVPLPQLTRRLGSAIDGQENDAIRPFASYQFARVHSGFLDTKTADDHTVTAGIRYRDVRTIMTETGGRGIYTELRGQVERVWSTSAAREQIIPGVRARLVSQPFGANLRLFGEARGDFKFYTDRPLSSGQDREDQRLRLTTGIDLSELFDGPFVEVAIQYQKIWSNDPTAEHDRLYFAPTLQWQF